MPYGRPPLWCLLSQAVSLPVQATSPAVSPVTALIRVQQVVCPFPIALDSTLTSSLFSSPSFSSFPLFFTGAQEARPSDTGGGAEAHHRVVKASALSIFPEFLPHSCPWYQIRDPVGQTKERLQAQCKPHCSSRPWERQ